MAHILVVDDDEILLKVVSMLLTRAGHTVATAIDGHEGLEKISRELFQMLICDVSMPRLSGYRVVSTVRQMEQYEKLPIMFLTGRRQKIDVVRAVKNGADDYIIKPIDEDILLAKVEMLLDRKHGPNSFTETTVEAPVQWVAEFEIIGISEQGVSLTSPVSFKPNHKFRLEAKLFEEIGIGVPILRVVEVRELDSKAKSKGKGKGKEFLIKLSFVGLGHAQHQRIRLWNMSQRQPKAA